MSSMPSPLPAKPHRMRWATVVALVAIGITIGFALTRSGVTGGAADDAAAVATLVPRAESSPVEYEWTATDLAGVVPLAVAELDGEPFVLSAGPEPPGVTLSTSADGVTWQQVNLELGPGARIDDVDPYGKTLLLSGSVDGIPTVWRSVANRRVDGTSWVATQLEYHGDELGPVFAGLTKTVTTVNSEGEVFVAATTYVDALGLMPTADDRDQTAATTDVALGQDTDVALGQDTDVALGQDRIWVRVADNAGDSELSTFMVPDGVNVMDAVGRDDVDLMRVGMWSSWFSEDAVEFDLNASRSRLPAMPGTLAYRSGFLGLAFDGRAVKLWQSATGRGWIESSWRPPRQCGGWESVAVSGDRLLLVTPLLDVVCVSDVGADWEVLATIGLDIAASANTRPATGGPEGFVMVTPGQSDWLLSSRDGVEWIRVATPTSVVTPRVWLVGERVLATGVAEPLGGPTWWVGEPSP